MIVGHIFPEWSSEDYINLDYSIALFHDNYEINEYISKGHSEKNMYIYKYLEPNPMPEFVYNYVYPHFKYLKNITSAINLFKPANYLPYHSDSYLRYKQIFNITTETIVRIVVMLENWQPGQIILIGNKSYSDWSAGDYFYWENDTKHSFYNMSLVNRYALQLTGIKT
jgi:hypothetical protein